MMHQYAACGTMASSSIDTLTASAESSGIKIQLQTAPPQMASTPSLKAKSKKEKPMDSPGI